MFDTVCSLPLSSDLFAQAVHPTEPLVAVGLSAGHVATLQLPPVGSDETHRAPRGGRRGSSLSGTGTIATAWRTRRHKGSCRCLAYSVDGRQLYSAGADGLVKAADSGTGVVVGKVAAPATGGGDVDAPTVVHALSPQTLLLATDAGALHLYDLRDGAAAFAAPRPAQTYHPHTDYISDLAAIAAGAASTSGWSKQWITTGSTTLAVTDLRRGVLAKSEDQEELLLSCRYVTGLAARRASGSSGEKAVVGGADGVLTLWEKGQWDDQAERVHVSRDGETLDCLAVVPAGVGGPGVKVAVGMGDGRVRFVRLGANRIVGENTHDEVEGVVELGFDVAGRMISGGGQIVKVWEEHMGGEEEEEEEEEEESAAAASKRTAESEDDSDDSDDVDDSSDEEETRARHKKKKVKQSGFPAGANASFSFAGLD